jgi:hypothetical protein
MPFYVDDINEFSTNLPTKHDKRKRNAEIKLGRLGIRFEHPFFGLGFKHMHVGWKCELLVPNTWRFYDENNSLRAQLFFRGDDAYVTVFPRLVLLQDTQHPFPVIYDTAEKTVVLEASSWVYPIWLAKLQLRFLASVAYPKWRKSYAYWDIKGPIPPIESEIIPAWLRRK